MLHDSTAPPLPDCLSSPQSSAPARPRPLFVEEALERRISQRGFGDDAADAEELDCRAKTNTRLVSGTSTPPPGCMRNAVLRSTSNSPRGIARTGCSADRAKRRALATGVAVIRSPRGVESPDFVATDSMSSVSASVKFLKRTSIAPPGARLFGCNVEGSEVGCLSRRNENPPAMRMPPVPSSGTVCAAGGRGAGGRLVCAAAGADRIRRRAATESARRASKRSKGATTSPFRLQAASPAVTNKKTAAASVLAAAVCSGRALVI